MPRTHGSFTLSVPTNVDLAYSRIKRKFGYRTHEELRVEFSSLYSTKANSNTFRYAAVPGASYTMKKDFSDYMHKGQGLFTIIEMYIEKESSESSSIEFNYTYADPGLSSEEFEDELASQVSQALRL